MTEIDLVQAISVNLLRLAEWYYKDPVGNAVICERYLDQSKKLSQQVKTPKAQAISCQTPEVIFIRSIRAHRRTLSYPRRFTATSASMDLNWQCAQMRIESMQKMRQSLQGLSRFI